MTAVKKKKRKKLKAGSRVCWDKLGVCKRKKDGLMAGPGKIESIEGKTVVFICPSMIGGTFRKTVPLKELVPV